MEVKKSKKADLERNKTLFFQIGLVLSLAIMIFAFEWSSDSDAAVVFEKEYEWVEFEDMIPITQEEFEVPLPHVTIETPQISNELVIVDNAMDIKLSDLFNFNSEDSEDSEVQEIAYTPPVARKVEEVEEDILFEVVQEKPSFMGGDASDFSKWVNRNIVYPQVAQENGISGRVVLQFRIGPDGKAGNVKVIRSIDPDLDNEAVRVVMSSPAWTPGRQNSKNIGVIYTFPVSFQLEY